MDNARRCADLFDVPVAIEGLYPSAREPWLVATWEEYRRLLDSGVPFALDLSHLNILATWSGRLDMGLTAEMLSSERCIEVHVSSNDGRHDQHRRCDAPAWWSPLLSSINPRAMVFTEGDHRQLET